jgi:hypothetical protein
MKNQQQKTEELAWKIIGIMVAIYGIIYVFNAL